jgi:hypothetical protein
MGSVFAKTPYKQRTKRYYKPPVAKPAQGAIAIEGKPAAQPKQRKRPERHEDKLQVRIARHIKSTYPDVIFFCDSGAGADLSDTQRKVMMSSRSDDGMCDMVIDEPSRGYHGLRLELKTEGTKIYKKDGKTLRQQKYSRTTWVRGKPFIKSGDHLQDQAAMIKKYRAKGYMAAFAVGYDDACNKIDKYLDRQQSLGVF